MSRSGGLLVGLGLFVASVSAGREWVRFTVRDPVLGLDARGATGYTVAPALSACGLVALAAVLVILLTRRRARISGLVVLAVSAVWAAWLIVGAVGDPVASAEAALTAPGAGGTAAQVVQSSATPWPWVCAAGTVLLLAGVVWLVWSWAVVQRAGRTAGSSASSAAPSPGGAAPSSEAERARRSNHDAWRDLSDGKDPTD